MLSILPDSDDNSRGRVPCCNRDFTELISLAVFLSSFCSKQ